eukprot:Gb_29664 [translate_table: standard]
MAMQEKMSASEGHPEGSKPQQPFRSNSSCLNEGNSIGSPTPNTNPNPFNIFGGGSTSRMPTSPPFNPFATCDPTSDIGQVNFFGSQQAPTTPKPSSNTSRPTNQFGNPPLANPISRGGPNPMSFGMPPYGNYGFIPRANPRMPNFNYGFNGGFPYTPYTIPSYQLNNMMQYSMAGNTIGFGRPFTPPFTNGTPSMPNSSNNYGGNGGNGGNNNSCNGNGGNGGNINDEDNSWPMIKEQFLDRFQTLCNPYAIYKALQEIKHATEETVRNYDGRLTMLVAKLKGRNTIPPIAMMNYFVDGLLPAYQEKIKLHPMRSYERVCDLAFEYENQVEMEDPARRYYIGGELACWNVNKGDPKSRETPKSKEAETIEKLTTKIEKMKISNQMRREVRMRSKPRKRVIETRKGKQSDVTSVTRTHTTPNSATPCHKISPTTRVIKEKERTTIKT